MKIPVSWRLSSRELSSSRGSSTSEIYCYYLDQKMTQNQNDIIDLKSRSIKRNILIHNLAKEDGEIMFIKIPALFKEHLGVDTKFINIHRNGFGKQDKPRSITGRLINFPDKEKILSAHKERKDKVPKFPIYITPQQPIQITEYRKKLVEVSTKYREDNVRTRILGNKLVFQNGTVYRDKVTKPMSFSFLRPYVFPKKPAIFGFWFCHYRGILGFRYLSYCRQHEKHENGNN